ncbi:MAG: hypothetical protein PF904_00175 [Kiritimatiellae bacterium]|jgi:hypothetical protein|nr:hypothetical protein [Kiritimatiellia bacterium]
MKFAVGYQYIEDGEPFSSIATDYRDHISEVYFAWIGQPSGRPILGSTDNEPDVVVQEQLLEELQLLRKIGIKLDLLLNANCYGERAISIAFEKEIIANSGCLRFCPAQTFHDNLIAHSYEAEKLENIPDWNPHLCWNLYKDPANFGNILKSTWIRPEDLSLYEGIADTVKLATRQHAHPRMVIGAYAEGSFFGNLLDLLEPGFSPAFAPNFINNSAFPPDWGKHISECDNSCESCGYCNQVLSKVLCNYCE